jgi:hypothetical protein
MDKHGQDNRSALAKTRHSQNVADDLAGANLLAVLSI